MATPFLLKNSRLWLSACKSATRACPPQAYRAAPRPAHRRAEARRWRRRGRSSRRASAARRQLARRRQAHRRAASSSSRSARAGAHDGAPGGEIASSSATRAERQSTPKPKGASRGLPCLSVGVRTGLRALGANHCTFEFAPAQHRAQALLRVTHHPSPSTTSDGQRGRAVASASPPPLRRWAGKRRGLRGAPARAVRAGGRTQGSGCDETAEAEGATRGVARDTGHRRPPPAASVPARDVVR